MNIKQLQERRLVLAAEAHDLESRLKAVRHELVAVCEALTLLRGRQPKPETRRMRGP